MKAQAGHSGFPLKETLTLVATLLIASNAGAASNPLCDKAARERAAIDAAALLIENVDHVPPVADLTAEEMFDLTEAEIPGDSPLLSVSPRVESMLDRVFEAPTAAADQPNSPLADNDTEAGDGRSALGDASLEVSPDISRIHRQMFRNDI